MASANGYVLDVGGFELRASWQAPFFVLVVDDVDEAERSAPLLIHCDSLEHARSHRGVVLNATFEKVDR